MCIDQSFPTQTYYTKVYCFKFVCSMFEFITCNHFSCRILRKIPKVEKSQKDILEDWKDTSARFEKSLRKTEEKLKEQINVGREVSRILCLMDLPLSVHFANCFSLK